MRKGLFRASYRLTPLSCFAQLDIWHVFCYTPNAELSFQAIHSDSIRADFCPYKRTKLKACLEAESNTRNDVQQWVNLKGFVASAFLCSQGFTHWCPQLSKADGIVLGVWPSWFHHCRILLQFILHLFPTGTMQEETCYWHYVNRNRMYAPGPSHCTLQAPQLRLHRHLK